MMYKYVMYVYINYNRPENISWLRRRVYTFPRSTVRDGLKFRICLVTRVVAWPDESGFLPAIPDRVYTHLCIWLARFERKTKRAPLVVSREHLIRTSVGRPAAVHNRWPRRHRMARNALRSKRPKPSGPYRRL